jgi:hypothetical protein
MSVPDKTLCVGALLDYEWDELTGVATLEYRRRDGSIYRIKALQRRHWTHPADRFDARREGHDTRRGGWLR